jgi:chromosome segregation protein
MKFFTRQLKRLEEREQVELELRGYLVGYYTTLWNDLSARSNTFTSERTALQAKINELTREQENKTRIFSNEEKHARMDDDGSFQSKQQSLNALQNERHQIQTRLSVLEGRLQTELIKTGQGQLAWLSQKKDELHARAVRLGQDIAGGQHELEILTLRAEAIRDELSRLPQDSQAPASDDERFVHIFSLVDAALDIHREGTHPDTPHARMKELFGIIKGQLTAIRDYLSDQIHRRAVRGEHDAASRARTVIEGELRELQTTQEILRERLRLRAEEKEKVDQECESTARELEYFAASDRTEQQQAILQEKEDLTAKQTKVEKEIVAIQQDLDRQYDKEKEKGRHLLELQKEITALQKNQDVYQQEYTKVALEVAKLEAHQEELVQKICDDLHVSESVRREIMQKTETLRSALGFSPDLPPVNLEESRMTIERLKRKTEQIGTIDEGLAQEHEETKQRYEFLTNQVADLESAKESLQKAVQELDAIIQERFEKNLDGISKKFTYYFQKLFGGGAARIIIQRAEIEEEPDEDQEDQTAQPSVDAIAGIEIEVTPPGKKFKSLSFLSGGEKTLTAIALLCAILAQNPSPFVILDEVDAALDESNAHRFAEIIQDLSSQTQFILITHNRVTMHVGHVLYGVTMGQDGISRTLSIDISALDAIVAK